MFLTLQRTLTLITNTPTMQFLQSKHIVISRKTVIYQYACKAISLSKPTSYSFMVKQDLKDNSSFYTVLPNLISCPALIHVSWSRHQCSRCGPSRPKDLLNLFAKAVVVEYNKISKCDRIAFIQVRRTDKIYAHQGSVSIY